MARAKIATAETPAHPYGRRSLQSQPELVAIRVTIANRVRAVQVVLGMSGTEMARSLDVPSETWNQSLSQPGHAIDGAYILRMIERHRVEPRWLQTGEGPMFRAAQPKVASPPQIFTARTGTGR